MKMILIKKDRYKEKRSVKGERKERRETLRRYGDLNVDDSSTMRQDMSKTLL